MTLVLQVLGLSIDALWNKLGEHIGQERVAMIRGALDRLAGAWEFIKDVQENGISAVWRYVPEQLSNLWDTLLDMAKEWIVSTVIARVTAKLITMLDPTGIMAVVNSFIAFFNAVQSAIEYLRDILEIVNRYTQTLAAVAAGNVAPGAQMIEGGLAAAIPVAIGFLANQVGLGNVPEKVVELIQRLRELVDRALDWLIAQALRLGRAALNALGLGREEEPAAAPAAGGPRQQAQSLLRSRLGDAKSHDEVETIVGQVRTELQPAGLTGLELRGPSAEGGYEIFAAAGEYTQLVAMVPSLGGPRSVSMNVRLLMHRDADLESEPSLQRRREAARGPGGEVLTDEQGRPQMVTTGFALPTVIPQGPRTSGKHTSGGVALPTVPGSGVIRLLTYNTSDEPRSDSNATHAEAQLAEFLERAPRIANDVDEIHADINWSPCSICSSTLSSVARMTRRASKRILNWHELYKHPRRGTTTGSLGQIGGSGWMVIPSAVSGETTAAEEAELQAADWASLTT